MDLEVQEIHNIKKDIGKLEWDLLPIETIEEIIKVLMYGNTIYPKNSWKIITNFNNRYYNAAMRHLSKWKKNYKKDSESNLSHLAHAATNIIFLLWRELNEK